MQAEYIWITESYSMSSTTSKVPNPASHIFHILPEDTHMFSKWAYCGIHLHTVWSIHGATSLQSSGRLAETSVPHHEAVDAPVLTSDLECFKDDIRITPTVPSHPVTRCWRAFRFYSVSPWLGWLGCSVPFRPYFRSSQLCRNQPCSRQLALHTLKPSTSELGNQQLQEEENNLRTV